MIDNTTTEPLKTSDGGLDWSTTGETVFQRIQELSSTLMITPEVQKCSYGNITRPVTVIKVQNYNSCIVSDM